MEIDKLNIVQLRAKVKTQTMQLEYMDTMRTKVAEYLKDKIFLHEDVSVKSVCHEALLLLDYLQLRDGEYQDEGDCCECDRCEGLFDFDFLTHGLCECCYGDMTGHK